MLPLLALLLTALLLHHVRSRRRKSALVITLSPANHSPRALAHAHALAARCPTVLLAHPPFPPVAPILASPLRAAPPHARLPWRLLVRTASLVRALVAHAPLNVTTVLVNTPPAIPPLPLLLLVRCVFPGAQVVLDWHNLAYTLMPPDTRLTALAAFVEASCARVAHTHWTVSKAMSDFLDTRFGIPATVLYDTPRAQFVAASHHVTPSVKHALLHTVSEIATKIGPTQHIHSCHVIVTSTSWTPDEDFTLLLSALKTLDNTASNMVMVITGRGPQRAHYETLFRESNFRNISIWLAWLPIADYPRLLACSTLGISLHASSSGLDLPMKVVDMLACGLPVLALRYQCVHELVKHARNGFLFDDASQLAALLSRLLVDEKAQLAPLRKRVRQSFTPDMQWETYWRRTALPTISSLPSSPSPSPSPSPSASTKK